MRAQHDRTYAEVGRAMARWLAEHDPHATPLADAKRIRAADLGVTPARLEALLEEHLTIYADGFLAGFLFAQEKPAP